MFIKLFFTAVRRHAAEAGHAHGTCHAGRASLRCALGQLRNRPPRQHPNRHCCTGAQQWSATMHLPLAPTVAFVYTGPDHRFDATSFKIRS